MKKSSLTTAVLAGLAGVVGFVGSSNAVELNPDGTGQVLIYPYYTTYAGQQTLVSVVNTTDVGKAVKVRFLEGYNSREVLDFNLFMSPYDVWTGTVFADSDAALSDDGASVGTSDNSCTVPSFAGLATVGNGLHYKQFSNQTFSGSDSDTGPTDISRTKEGYVEMITMADVTGATLAAITHHQPDGVPPGCASASLRNTLNADFVAPTGGLFGNGAVVNVGEGTFYPYSADAVDGFTSDPNVTDSGSLFPNLSQASGPAASAPVAYVFAPGGTSIPATYTANPVDAVSAVFQSSAVMNEWAADADAGTGTDWVVTFPTKRFYVDGVPAAIQPFTEAFGENNDGQSCVVVGITVYNREEGTLITHEDDQWSPAPPGAPPSSLCHEVNVVSISDKTDPVSILGSPRVNGDGGAALDVNVNPYGTAGWMNLDMNPATEAHALRASDEGVVLNGLPVTGFAAERYINANAQPGKLSNYSGAFRHRFQHDIASSAAP